MGFIKKHINVLLSFDNKLEWIVSFVFIPLLVLTFYFLFFSKVLPEGVNKVFATRSGQYLLLVASPFSIVLALAFWKAKKKLAFYPTKKDKVIIGDFILLLLPLIPVVQYLWNNLDILSKAETIYIHNSPCAQCRQDLTDHI